MDEFRTLTLSAAVYVAHHMREMDRECLRAVSTITDPEVFGLNRWQTDGAAWALFDTFNEPVAIGGISQHVPWCGTAWMVATDAMQPASWKKLIRHSRKVFRNAAKSIPRIEAQVLAGWAEADVFARSLNFELEGVRRRAGRDGQDILTFVYQGSP
ncbi:hypothetical protein RD110_08095 [Rhodoferax koreense]|uniref:N-acetyltransferase domain-containing protein n=1 Tax=Rhodoferax koreensis TaxID=1842727 RepID=A0A1P8JTT7_9BURK|nr:hypothetical protein [Rhodoferax koreense]APW37164.1 hypothetical protein RD110_08095 [Rhodoferax koreense]